MTYLNEMSVRDASELVGRLTLHSTSLSPIAEQIAALEFDCRTAAKLIKVLLCHVNPTDVFKLPPE